jgi:hypothetical protein
LSHGHCYAVSPVIHKSLFFWESRLQHKCAWWLQVLWKFWIFNVHETIFRFIMQNTGKRCVILLFFIILRWSFNYESNVFRYNKILIDCVFGNSKFLVPSTPTINLGFASVNSQCLGDNKLPIPSYPVNKYILLHYFNTLLHIQSFMDATNIMLPW